MTLASNKIMVRIGGKSHILHKDHSESMKCVEYRLLRSSGGDLFGVHFTIPYLQVSKMNFRDKRHIFRGAAYELEKCICLKKSK